MLLEQTLWFTATTSNDLQTLSLPRMTEGREAGAPAAGSRVPARPGEAKAAAEPAWPGHPPAAPGGALSCPALPCPAGLVRRAEERGARARCGGGPRSPCPYAGTGEGLGGGHTAAGARRMERVAGAPAAPSRSGGLHCLQNLHLTIFLKALWKSLLK